MNASWPRPWYDPFFSCGNPHGKMSRVTIQSGFKTPFYDDFIVIFYDVFFWILHCNMLEMIITHVNPVRFLGMTLRVFFITAHLTPVDVNIGFLSSMIIHDHPLSSIIIHCHYHPLSSIIHYHPLSSIYHFHHYHPLSSIIIHYHPLSSIIIHYHPFIIFIIIIHYHPLSSIITH